MLIYGAYGYTGELAARRAVALGMKPVLAGRDEGRTRALARELDLPWRAFSLDDTATVDGGLRDAGVVLHCAGPFHRTYQAMAEACLRTGTHYLDITGEVAVFEGLARRGADAERAGVMLMPGVGLDVVPTDCLAAHLARRLPAATELDLAFSGVGAGPSVGTLSTAVESLDRGSLVRRGGRLVPIRMGALRRDVDLGRGPKAAVAIPWGDVSTAYHSTGIPDISVYMPLGTRGVWGARIMGRLSGLARLPGVKSTLLRRVRAGKPGPDAAERDGSFTVFWGEARDAQGNAVAARMRTPNGYTLTAITGVDIARRVLDGGFEPGFRTPSSVFGADYILGIEGVERTDLD